MANSPRQLSRPAANPRELLARLSQTPHLARAVPLLPAELLHGVIQHVGLEECGELLMLATTEQLSAVFDLDLWRADAAGRDEQFDVARFCQWLDVLADTDVTAAAQRVAELDPTLVIAGFASQIAVFDPAAFASPIELTGGDVAANGVLEGRLHADVGGYIVAAKREESWDTIIAVLLALDEGHRAAFDRVMRGCRQLSNSRPEVDGLDDLLGDAEQSQFDLGISREQRRDDRGYVSPAQARAFLQSARSTDIRSVRPPQRHPIFAAFLQSMQRPSELDGEVTDVPTLTESEAIGADESIADVAAVVDLLRGAGVLQDTAQRLLPGASSDAAHITLVERHLQLVRDRDDATYESRMQELAFLGNVLLSGCSLQERPFTEREASRAAAAICNLGLENWPRQWRPASRSHRDDRDDVESTDEVLLHHDMIAVFHVGWSILYRDVSMFAAEQLLQLLADLRCSDRDVATGLYTLRRELAKQWRAGTPWHARKAFDVLAILDLPAWAALLGLIDECPVMLANVARHPSAVHSITVSEFEFISGNAHLASIRSFVRDLPNQLIRS